MTLHIEACKSCDSPIIWSITPYGHRMPVDASPSPRGNVVVSEPNDSRELPVAVVVGREEARGQPRYTSHFVTCVRANEWRRAR